MDFSEFFTEFMKGVDLFLVVGIILFIAAVRWILDAFKVEVPETIIRIIVLALGMAVSLAKIDFWQPAIVVAADVVGKGFAYGGAATLAYQLYKAGMKRLFPDVPDRTVPPNPTQGLTG